MEPKSTFAITALELRDWLDKIPDRELDECGIYILPKDEHSVILCLTVVDDLCGRIFVRECQEGIG